MAGDISRSTPQITGPTVHRSGSKSGLHIAVAEVIVTIGVLFLGRDTPASPNSLGREAYRHKWRIICGLDQAQKLLKAPVLWAVNSPTSPDLYSESRAAT